MKKLNVKSIGTVAGVTVNTTENVVDRVKYGVPATKDSLKKGTKTKWGNVKKAYKTARQGEPIEMPRILEIERK